MHLKNQTGFTLIEIAIVLVIVSVLLGYTVALFPIQQELKHYREGEQEMDEIVAALVGFAQINGRLPCPDTSGGGGTIDGQEDESDVLNNDTGVLVADGIPDSCLGYFGFVPSATIGFSGDIDATGRLLDPWGQPYLYHVSDVNTDSDSDATTAAADDLVSPNGIRDEGMVDVAQAVDLLYICTDSNAVGSDLDCGDVSGVSIVDRVAAVIVSTGKDLGQVASSIQSENSDDLHDGTNDKVYISSTRSDVAGSEYDDLVKWVSTTMLFSKMIEAGQLP